jgi:hypothetical protein
MFIESKTFLGESGEELTSATWVLPDGESVLVCQGDEGFQLYTPAEWNNALMPSYAADAEGRVRLHGHYVDRDNPAWVVPPEVRAKARPSGKWAPDPRERTPGPGPLSAHSVTLPAELWAAIQGAAEHHRRSVEEELAWIIREHFAARRQHIPPAEPAAGSPGGG